MLKAIINKQLKMLLNLYLKIKKKFKKSLKSNGKGKKKLDLAVILRDRIKALNIIQSSQRINEANLVEADVIAGYKESGKTCVQVFLSFKTKLGQPSFFPKHDPEKKLGNIKFIRFTIL